MEYVPATPASTTTDSFTFTVCSSGVVRLSGIACNDSGFNTNACPASLKKVS